MTAPYPFARYCNGRFPPVLRVEVHRLTHKYPHAECAISTLLPHQTPPPCCPCRVPCSKSVSEYTARVNKLGKGVSGFTNKNMAVRYTPVTPYMQLSTGFPGIAVPCRTVPRNVMW